MSETYNIKPHKGPKAPLEVVRVMPARNGTVRFCLNSGSHVTALATGQYACLARKCIDAGKANTCEHVRFVEEYDKANPDAASDPYLNQFAFAGPTGGVHQSLSAEHAPRRPAA